jgi:hypothetical protein
VSVGKPTWGDNRLAYKQRFEEFVQQRFSGLAGLVRDAGEGYPQRLIDYFESNSPRKLSQNEWSSLFWLFNKLPRSGRPRGSVKPKNLAIQCASYLVRWGKRTQRLAKGKTTKAVNEKLYKRAVELMEWKSHKRAASSMLVT